MKRSFTVVLTLALLGTMGSGQEKSETGTHKKDTSSAVQKYIIQLEEEWTAAEQKGDKDSLSSSPGLNNDKRSNTG
jgi:hypothetical protein